MNTSFDIIIYTRQIQTFAYAFVSILQIILTHKSNVYLPGGITLLGKESAPRFHCRCLTDWNARLAHYGSIQSLALHAYRYLVYTRHILALHYTFQVYVAERRHFHTNVVVQMAFRA